jgi:hypothetical protein
MTRAKIFHDFSNFSVLMPPKILVVFRNFEEKAIE